MRYIIIFILSLFSLNTFALMPEFPDKNPFIVMIGPTVHFKLGNRENRSTNYGIEASCWLDDFIYYDEPGIRNLPMGFDIGFEWEKKIFRAYSEFQAGRIFYGAAIGPVYERERVLKINKIGVQGSVWANALVGADARARYINKQFVFRPGLYAKVPIASNFPILGE